MEKIKLYCLPYAGGSATIYYQWERNLPGSIQLRPLELAGRGKRFSETFYNSLPEAVDDLYQLIQAGLDEAPYAFFGHSMGSLLVYELTRRIKANRHTPPVHLFLSGMYPPHINKFEKIYHSLPDDQFTNEILRMGGTPSAILEHRELLEIFLPILRADYRILESHQFISDHRKLDCALTLFTGKQDEDITLDDLQQWREYTDQPCQIYQYGGGHFFIHDKMPEILKIITDTLIQPQRIEAAASLDK